jgi:hypothetical protein
MHFANQNENPNMRLSGGIYKGQLPLQVQPNMYLNGGSMQQQPDMMMDPYAPSIVQDLLSGSNDWKNIQDIVKLTFKAICDVIRQQGLALRELERAVPTKASKAEVNAGLSLKANVADVSRTLADLASTMESKLSFEEVQTLLDDRVSKSDL